MQLGLIKEYRDLYLGVTAAYARSSNRWSELQARNKSDNYLGEVLIGIHRGLGFLELYANAGYLDHKMGRDMTLGANLNGGAYNPLLDCDLTDNYYNGVYSVQHAGDYQARILGGGLRIGYQKVFCERWLFLPTLGVNFMDVRNPKAFTEDGPYNAAFRLVFGRGEIKRQTLLLPLMLRVSRSFVLNICGSWLISPEARIGVTANLLDRGGKAKFKWLGNPIPNRYMQAWGLEEERLSCQAGGGIEFSKRGRFYGAVNYDYYYQKGAGSHSYSFQAGLNF
jgi:hypothetical protein